MSRNSQLVIDMDAHIRERADRFCKDYIDPAYRGPYRLLCEAIAEQIETGRPPGVHGTFGLSERSEMERGRIAFPPGRRDPMLPIREEVNWNDTIQLEDMDRAEVDVTVLYPTYVSSYCALRDAGFKNAPWR